MRYLGVMLATYLLLAASLCILKIGAKSSDFGLGYEMNDLKILSCLETFPCEMSSFHSFDHGSRHCIFAVNQLSVI